MPLRTPVSCVLQSTEIKSTHPVNTRTKDPFTHHACVTSSKSCCSTLVSYFSCSARCAIHITKSIACSSSGHQRVTWTGRSCSCLSFPADGSWPSRLIVTCCFRDYRGRADMSGQNARVRRRLESLMSHTCAQGSNFEVLMINIIEKRTIKYWLCSPLNKIHSMLSVLPSYISQGWT